MKDQRIEEMLGKAVREGSYLFGPGSYIYSLGNDLIAKSVREDTIEHEYKIGCLMHESGVTVPFFHGIYSPPLVENSSRRYIVMDRIEGKTLNYLDDLEFMDAASKFKDEIKKVLSIGIVPEDSLYLRNSIYTPSKELFLIDFGMWGRGNIVQRESFRLRNFRGDKAQFH